MFLQICLHNLAKTYFKNISYVVEGDAVSDFNEDSPDRLFEDICGFNSSATKISERWLQMNKYTCKCIQI